ncbi:MAG: hypothetical protein KKC26_01045, partial [Nanoarchaeota archaeon]|nr:hypothetical protein [Nanoarchaeota archaeon]
CNLSVIGAINNSVLINATTGESTTYTMNGFVAGNYTWNVSCVDNSNLRNYSENRIFHVISEPTVILQSPTNFSTDGDGNIVFWYVPQDLEGLSFCNFYLDGEYNETKVPADGGVKNGQPSNFTKTGLNEGTHTWYVNCTDTDSNFALSDTWTIYVDLTDPHINIFYPEGNIINISTVVFNWTVTDNMDVNLTCDLTINRTIYSDITSSNGSVINYTVSDLTDGLQFWNVTCTDDGGRTNTSLTYNFTITEPPKVSLDSPTNNFRNNSVNLTLFYTATDNSGTIQNCTLILNGANNETNSTVGSGEQDYFNLHNLLNGTYTWDVNCTDPNGNAATNETAKTFYVDLTPPTIVLNSPSPGETFNDDFITFNWTATDFAGTTITCNISVSDSDGDKNATGLTSISGVSFNYTFYNLSDGIHYWNVTCSDDLGNKNNSQTQNFTINQPDVDINNSMIYFNNTNPDLGENTTIFANVTNIGGNPATNLLVEFWDGLPSTGTLIGNDTATVNVNATVTFSTSWVIDSGYHNIWVLLDPKNVIGELDETNNNATLNISVLSSVMNSPENDTWTNNETTEINFTLTDYTGGTINYTIFVDGSSNGQTGQVSDQTFFLLNVTFASEGIRTIIVEALDALGRRKNSTILNRKFDKTVPTPVFETQNNTFFNDTTPEISFNLTDNLATTINYTLYVDGVYETNSSTTAGTTINYNISSLGEGKHNLTLEGTDEAGNSANSTTIWIYVDLTKPSIELLYPADNDNFSATIVELNFTVTDNLDSILTCNLTLDEVVNRTNFEVSNGSTSNTTIRNLIEGTHTWNVTCWDGRNQQNIVNINTSNTRSFNVYIAPNISEITPADDYWTNNENITFYFNVSDDTGVENCSFILNGEINLTKSGSEITNNVQNNFTVSYLDGHYNWSITCFDNTTIHSSTTINNRSLHVDLEDPSPVINTQTNTWFNTGTPGINITITDNMDLTLNYTFFVNGSTNAQGEVTNDNPTVVNLQPLDNGSYEIIVEGLDEAGNRKNSTSINIYVDTIEPKINLSAPENGELVNSSTVNFNFTATDNMAQNLTCGLYIDGELNQTINTTSGILVNVTVTDFNPGIYWWNVTCTDLAGNSNTSLTWNYTVPLPDLQILGSNIQFNETNPEENKTIIVNATITNEGNVAAGSFIVQFYRGDPDDDGVKIENKTVSSLNAGSNVTVAVNYTTIIGPNQIFVQVDIPLVSNGQVTESDETNNEANNTFNVGLYHVVTGTTNDFLELTDLSAKTLFSWDVTNLTKSNIFVVDSDSVVSWDSLQAISRNTTNASTTNDFEEIDLAFGSTNYSDSINTTYTSSSSPKSTAPFYVFNKNITDVPIVNSTINTNFVTGILWDYNDGGSEYNGTQDLIFISEVNENKVGQYGTYDFEIKIPALLRTYVGVGSSVDFYTEIK